MAPEKETWRKSTFSNGTGGECVEVSDLGRVRDSKNPEGPKLTLGRRGLRALLAAVSGDARD